MLLIQADLWDDDTVVLHSHKGCKNHMKYLKWGWLPSEKMLAALKAAGMPVPSLTADPSIGPTARSR